MKNEIGKIGLLGNGFSGWGGGLDFLRFCANALAFACDDSIKIVVLLPDPECLSVIGKARRFLSPYKRIMLHLLLGKMPVFYRYRPFSKKQLRDSFNNIDGNVEVIFYPPEEEIASVVASINADVVIPSAFSLGSSFPVPWVGYVHDFQHKYYPDYFSTDEIKERDAHFCHMLTEAKAVIVNAADVTKDVNRYFPDHKCKIFQLPFSATPIESWFESPKEQLDIKYNLPERYFVICNQFWIHKDHPTAFKALSLYNQLGGDQDVHIVCTGNTTDTRHPDYFFSLQKLVTQLGLTDRIHFLGHIPKKDQIDIMKGAIAVLQPTLFEGGPGGGAVYDAVAMGMPAVISDIPVNREIDGNEGLLYFKAMDAQDMAEKMIAIHKLQVSKQDMDNLLSAGRKRTKAFGLRLIEAIEYVRPKR